LRESIPEHELRFLVTRSQENKRYINKQREA